MAEKLSPGSWRMCGIDAAFGVISIHNMPLLDAIGRRQKIRFVPSRGEAGAVNMADAYARVANGIGVAISSTGTGAGNAAGSLVEALSAGSPVLHLTGQVDVRYLDRNCGYTHEAPNQLAMLKAVSKAAFRVWSVGELSGILKKAAMVAQTPPTGPVSIEIPIDVQHSRTNLPLDLGPMTISVPVPTAAEIAAIANMARQARRPMLWLGGGARNARMAVERLVGMGFGVVTSVGGRGIIAEDHPMSIGALQAQAASQTLYQSCDLMLVVGSRLRSSDTKAYSLELPRPLVRIDVDPDAQCETYPADRFMVSDAAAALGALADCLEGRRAVAPTFAADLANTRKQALAEATAGLGPYGDLCTILRKACPRDCIWVRDVTLANSTWGNRVFPLFEPRQGVHAAGGGIGQGLAMGIGAAIATSGKHKVVVLVGDGGLTLNLGELATLVQEKPDLMMIVMNDEGYGVIRNMQDARFERRRYFVDLETPAFTALATSLGIKSWKIESINEFAHSINEALDVKGPTLIEVNMAAVGPYAIPFSGPPIAKRMD